MALADILVLSGSATVLFAVSLLRMNWGKPGRSTALNAVAWSLLLCGLLSGASGHGAWGLAITVLAGMAIAGLLLCHSALVSPAGKAKAANRRVHMLPEAGEPKRIARRFATFVLTVPCSLAAAFIFALGARAIAAWFGWSDANANVLALLAMPVVWSVLMTQLLMTQGRKPQLLSLAMATAMGAVPLGLGAIGS